MWLTLIESKVAGIEAERMCECGICGGPRFIDGPSLGNGFGFSDSDPAKLNLSGEFMARPGLELALKKDGGSSLSFHDFAFAFCAVLAEASVWITSNNASKCLLALGSSITDVFLSSPANDPSAKFSLMTARTLG